MGTECNLSVLHLKLLFTLTALWVTIVGKVQVETHTIGKQEYSVVVSSFQENATQDHM